MRKISKFFPICLLLFATFVACDDDTVDPIDEIELEGAIFTLTNDFDDNEVVFYERADDGRLTLVGSYSTGGQGFNINEPEAPGFNDPLGSQGAIALSPDRNYLYAVNAGSNSVTSFRIEEDRLERLSTVSSGGLVPIAVTATDDNVYVVNNGGPGSVTAYSVDDGTLGTLTDGTTLLGRADGLGAATVLAHPDGDYVVVTTKPDSKVLLFETADNGNLRGFTEMDAAGTTPFGSAWLNDDILLTTEAFMGNMGEGALTSYRLDDGALTAVTPSLGTGQTASCWVALSPNNEYAYTSNTPDGTITTFRVRNDGSLTATGDGANGTVPDPMGSFVLDMVTVDDDEDYLYVVVNTTNQIIPFRIDGANLVRMDEAIVTDANLLQTGRVTGLVGF